MNQINVELWHKIKKSIKIKNKQRHVNTTKSQKHGNNNNLQPSPPLPSTTIVFHRWSFIETSFFGNFQGLYERSMGLRGIVFFFLPSSFLLPCLPSNSEATSMSYQSEPLVRLPPRNSFRFLCNKIRNSFRFLCKKLKHYCNVLFKYQWNELFLSFCLFISVLFAFNLRISKLKIEKVLEKSHSGFWNPDKFGKF